MAVTKEVYNLPIGFSLSDLCNIYRDAFIDAGYMANWYHSFTEGGRQHRVMEITYDGAKTYGKTYYCFSFESATGGGNGIGLSIGTGFDTGTDSFSGTQFVDYHVQPPSTSPFGGWRGTPISIPNAAITNTQEYFLYRYTSQDDPTQSWFMSRVNTGYSSPFTILHPSTTIHPWLDMNIGPISGFINVVPTVRGHGAVCSFGIQEAVRRCVGIGSALIGSNDTSFGNNSYHAAGITTHTYVAPGLGLAGNVASNFGASTVNNSFAGGGHIVLPIGRNSINPAYASDFTPVCTDVPFSYYTNKLLASDFGIYGHYANNIQQPLDKFITTPGVEEWEIIARANNDTITTKASINFLARVV